ncbi:putative transcriptional regulatory protein YvfU [Kroppenstedtia guangzhouensis]|jgi:two-component system, NarL family, response regulator DesR|uniref:Transcriptional regulatory protein YvfU n=1 Tax=Kroppenstedtia guangzhouensis TaxID=1274356 RepID=A0ABQ1G3B2_9BACL|nr:response regulator transcription factor [Kroppenstedtia guangzhouensis]GGA36575.1 putative transcriptional regulatory protein YvfU [Kroppenstedtia guangzhouensis]
MIRIVIAEDQKMLRGALTSLLQLEDDLEVVAQVTDGEEALDAVEKHRPDLCLLDIEIPKMTGLEVAEKVREKGLPSKIIIVTTFTRPGYLQKAMELKVEGYLLKDEPIDFLVDAIRSVVKGQRVISTDLAPILFNREENPLTEREQEVLRLAAEGETTAQIANNLFLSKGTVRNYLSTAIQKMGVVSRYRAIQKAQEKGWI